MTQSPAMSWPTGLKAERVTINYSVEVAMTCSEGGPGADVLRGGGGDDTFDSGDHLHGVQLDDDEIRDDDTGAAGFTQVLLPEAFGGAYHSIDVRTVNTANFTWTFDNLDASADYDIFPYLA